MASTSLAASERAALCDLLDELGPDAPTLCAGWRTSDMAAHLYVRERRPLAGPGILIKPLAGFTQREMAKALERHGYKGLVAKVRSGPPLAWRPLDRGVNTLEYLVHHEDVRRGATGWEPRLDKALDDAAWAALRRGAKFLGRGVKGAGLELVRPGGERVVARNATPRAEVTGGPVELLLFLYGRGAAARITVEGDVAARAALERAKFGI
jgi:uncharacterized protein (TIGR03085 family)